jgi:hypothetical protein
MAEHSVVLDIYCVRGTIGWHFSRYCGHVLWRSDYNKMYHRDGTNNTERMKPGERWHETFPIFGPATFVLDFPDWDDNPSVEVQLAVDTVLVFGAAGETTNLQGWSPYFGPGVEQTDPREIAFAVD